MKAAHENKMSPFKTNSGTTKIRQCVNCYGILIGDVDGKQICEECFWVHFKGKVIKKGCGCDKSKKK